MASRTEEFRYHHDETKERNLDLRQLVHQDPRAGNTRILEAFQDLDHNSRQARNQTGDYRPGTPVWTEYEANRAHSFAREMAAELPQIHIQKASENWHRDVDLHGTDHQVNLNAAISMGNAIQKIGESVTAWGLVSQDKDILGDGRTLMAQSVNAVEKALHNPELCQELHQTQKSMDWNTARKGPEEMQASSDAQAAFIQIMKESVQDTGLSENLGRMVARSLATSDWAQATLNINEELKQSLFPDRTARPDYFQNTLGYHAQNAATDILDPTRDDSPTSLLRWKLQTGEDTAPIRQQMAEVQEGIQALIGMTRIPEDENFPMIWTDTENMRDYVITGELKDSEKLLRENLQEAVNDTQDIPAVPNGYGQVRARLQKDAVDSIRAAQDELDTYRWNSDRETLETIALHVQSARILSHFSQEQNFNQALDEHRRHAAA